MWRQGPLIRTANEEASHQNPVPLQRAAVYNPYKPKINTHTSQREKVHSMAQMLKTLDTVEPQSHRHQKSEMTSLPNFQKSQAISGKGHLVCYVIGDDS